MRPLHKITAEMEDCKQALCKERDTLNVGFVSAKTTVESYGRSPTGLLASFALGILCWPLVSILPGSEMQKTVKVAAPLVSSGVVALKNRQARKTA